MRSIRVLTVTLLVAAAGVALADDHNHSGGNAAGSPPAQGMPMPPAAGGGSSMPMGMDMMPMQGGSASKPASPGSGSMGMDKMPMPGGAPGQGSSPQSMTVPGAPSGMSMGCMMPMMQAMSGGRAAASGMAGGTSMPSSTMGTNLVDHVEGRLAFLKAELHLKDGQLPLWEAFASVVRSAQKDVAGMAQPSSAGSVAQRLEAGEQQQVARLQALRQLRGVVGPLYTALDDPQKRAFDQLSQHPLGLL